MSGGNAAWRALGDEPGKGLGIEEEEEAARPGRQPLEILDELGFRGGAAEVVAMIKGRQPMSREEAQRMVIRGMRKGGSGRRGLPDAVVAAMYRDYWRVGSLRKLAALYNRSNQALGEMFRRRGLSIRERDFQTGILWGGRKWTLAPGKGYFRPTTGDRELKLHVEIWKARGGVVPAGWVVTCRNGEMGDFREGNLVCVPRREATLLHYRRRYPARAGMTSEQRREMWRTHYRLRMRRVRAENVAKGLRTDGKWRRRPVIYKGAK